MPSQEPALLPIGEVARLVGVSPSTLRLWERNGLIAATRTPGGARRWATSQVELARRVAYLRRVEKLNSAAIRRDAPSPARARAEAPLAQTLGHRLRYLRQKQRLPLREVARRAGVSVSFLSTLERGLTGVSVATLGQLLAALGTTTLSLFETSHEDGRVVRARDRKLFTLGSNGVRIEQLAAATARMEPQLFTIAPGRGSEGTYHHEGEEFLFILKGQLEFVLGEERYLLDVGDSLYCPSDIPHQWRNPGRSNAVVLWVNTPPTF